MRIIRVKLKEEVKVLLEAICARYKAGDRSFAEDLYALVRCKGNGLPDQQRLEALSQAHAAKRKMLPLVVKGLMNKRKAVLSSIAKTAMFQNFVTRSSKKISDLEFTELLIITFKKIHHKLRQAQCLTCPLFNSCDFGQQYSKTVRNITAVIDPDYKKKVNPNCPNMPGIELVNEMQASADLANKLAEEEGKNQLAAAGNNALKPSTWNPNTEEVDESLTNEMVKQMAAAEAAAIKTELLPDSDLLNVDTDDEDDVDFSTQAKDEGTSVGSSYGNKHSGANFILNDQTVDKIKVSHLLIYELARKLETALDKHKKGTYNPTSDLTDKTKHDKIKSIGDVTKVVKTQLAQDDDSFDAKLAKKQLIKNQNQKPEAKRQLLYLLIDVSGSMASAAGISPQLGFVSRAALAAAFSIALIRRVRDDGGIIFVRTFDDAPSRLISCRTREEFIKAESWIASASFFGGGTHIPRALKIAYTDISNAKDELARAEVLMITDAGDNIRKEVPALRMMYSKVAVNVLDCVGGPENKFLSAKSDLEALADNYYKIDPKKNTLDSMINLVGGKKHKKD